MGQNGTTGGEGGPTVTVSTASELQSAVNQSGPLIVQVSLDAGGVILTSSALSFLGLGAQDPVPDWGLMIAEGENYFSTQWWVATFPGLAILLTALAFTLLGDGLRDLLDPRRLLPR